MRRKQTALLSAAIILTITAYLTFNSGAIASTKGNGKPRTLETDQFWKESGSTSPLGGQTRQLNTGWWEKNLRQAPLETPGAVQKQNGTLITLPAPDGALQGFRLVKSPIMEAELAERYPQLQTFAFRGVDDPTATGRFSWTPEGPQHYCQQ